MDFLFFFAREIYKLLYEKNIRFYINHEGGIFMTLIKSLLRTINNILKDWGDERIDEWDEEYLSMTL